MVSQNILRIFTLKVFTFLLFCSNLQGQPSALEVVNELKYGIIQQSIFKIANRYHYNQNTMKNKKFSSSIFKEYLNNLDHNKELFLTEDIKKLEKFKPELTNNILNNNLTFFKTIESIYQERFASFKAYSKKTLEEPFRYTTKDYYDANFDNLNYCKNRKEQEKRWYKTLKWYSIDYYYNLLKEQENLVAKGEDVEVKDASILEKKARATTLRNLNNRFDYIEKQNLDERYALYINSILAVYDPHTEYLLPAEKEDFDISMSGKFEGIGAVLQKSDGNIKVVRIMPGGAAWQQKELKAGDIIIKVAQGYENNPVSIANLSLRDAVSLIRGKKNSVVLLTVKKMDGVIKKIPIVRDIIITEESYIKYIIIKDQVLDKKYGYIHVPIFYRDFSDKKGASVSEDIKEALKQFKKEEINGLVIDLQSNGGGSLIEAIELSGLFIDGPVVQVKNSADMIKSYRPKNTKPIYDGPMIVLVNRYSASASEIFAAAMQDYKRAVVVGSSTSYGKGTVQQVVNLSNVINDNYNYLAPFGALKLTFEKFYRVNGSTTQNIGITPDIILSNIYSKLDIGERSYQYALKADSIPKVFYYTSGNYDQKLQNFLKEKSNTRVKNNKVFIKITETAQILKERRDKSKFTLNYEKLEKEKELLKEVRYSFVQSRDKTLELILIMKESGIEEQRLAYVDEWAKKILTNPYLLESMYILRDQNTLK